MNRAKLIVVCAVVFFSIITAGQEQPHTQSPKSWAGILINNSCNVADAFAEAEKCTTPDPTSQVVFYDDTVRQIYSLDPQPNGHLGEAVTVRGTLDGMTIHMASIEPLTSFGLNTGQKAPDFSLQDQFGKEQTLATLRGPKGTVLLFFRSADWCPYCKGQLIQLESAKARFAEQGLKIAGISYDSEAILKSFADRRMIDFPLLSDADSKVIEAYRVLNAEAVGINKGMARPGYFFIDTNGVIGEKFFEAKYRERLTGNNALAKIFPALADQVTDTIQEPHLAVRLEQSDQVGMPGNLIILSAEITLPKDVHVYAPGTAGYKPIQLELDPTEDAQFRPVLYPPAKTLYLQAIKERVPAFEGTFRMQQEIKINASGEYSAALPNDGKKVAIKGRLNYQACDSKICFLPASVPVEWHLQVLRLDTERAPADIRHK